MKKIKHIVLASLLINLTGCSLLNNKSTATEYKYVYCEYVRIPKVTYTPLVNKKIDVYISEDGLVNGLKSNDIQSIFNDMNILVDNNLKKDTVIDWLSNKLENHNRTCSRFKVNDNE